MDPVLSDLTRSVAPRFVVLRVLCLIAVMGAVATAGRLQSQAPGQTSRLDKQVQAFLERRRGTWQDLNVPETDGRVLHRLILERRFTRALEIGTSTGHSGVWIAWALAKTGGRLITVEIDPGRRQSAVENFKETGLASVIDSRLGDAHQIVPALPGPFDLVFSDADKDWYKNYFVAVWPKVLPGGCFTAHNVSRLTRVLAWISPSLGGGAGEFLAHLKTVPDGVTTIDTSSSQGISITCKRDR
jgi:predicted O-methyltransferase YrrM